MMKNVLFPLLISSFLFSCKNHRSDAAAASDADSSVQNGTAGGSGTPASAGNVNSGDTSTAAPSFFPVADFIGGQLRWVDSMQMPLTKSVTIDHKTTTMSLSDAEFKVLAANFRQPDFSGPALRKFYKESSYADRSMPSVVLTYTATRPDLELRKVDVIIQPDPVKSDKVRTIYMEKQRTSGDTIVQQKLYWKANHNFQIITEKQLGSTRFPAEQLKVVWDPTN